jgi:hypothetical protein
MAIPGNDGVGPSAYRHRDAAFEQGNAQSRLCAARPRLVRRETPSLLRGGLSGPIGLSASGEGVHCTRIAGRRPLVGLLHRSFGG